MSYRYPWLLPLYYGRIMLKFCYCEYYICVILVLMEVVGLHGGYQVGYFDILKDND